MRVNSVQGYPAARITGRVSNSGVRVNNNSDNSSVAAPKIVRISFTGKNIEQVASITPENNGLGLPEAAQGGEGVVGFELPESLKKHEKVKIKQADGTFIEKTVDARSFMPFWEHNNPKGGYKFLIHKGIKREELRPPAVVDKAHPAKYDTMPAQMFYSANLGEDIETVAKRFGVPLDEISYVIQSKPNGSGPDAPSKYCILEPTSAKGEIVRLSDSVLGETQTVPYRLFKISDINPTYNKLKGGLNYFYYTPSLARASKPYSYDCWGNVPFEAEVVNSDGMRALAKAIHSQMNTEEFGYYNPANVIAHDRIANTYGNHIANMSAAGDKSVNGIKTHLIDHNTGRNYQGVTDNPFKFLTVVADASDAEKIKALPYFDILNKASQYGINSDMLSPREQQIAHAVIDPVLDNFRDGAGTYNILKTGISSARLNPDNISVGTVSHTFDAEMKSSETPDAAKFLTEDFASITTKSAGNGVTPANMKFDDPTAPFGRGDNGLSAESPKGFTPFKYNGSNIEEVIAAKEKNARWLTDLIWKAGEKGQDALNELFFNKGQIADGHNVIGYLSPIKDGEILVFGFGRPDEQKGYPMTTGGYLDFLKRKDIPQETKLKVKVLLGAGPWNKDADDYKAIVHDINEIQNLDGGIYKHNIMYIDGFTPNKITGCCHYGMFTSRREMYGITPIECKIAGTPYGTTKTGGPVDYTNSKNGFLTKNAVELRPERFGLTYANSEWEIDQARINAQKPQVGDIFAQMIDEYSSHRDVYVAKSKKNIEELVDWHNNAEYNHGKSANRIYLDDILETDKGWEARNKNPLQRIMGEFGEFKEEVETILGPSAKKSKPVKAILLVVGSIAVLSGGYYIWKKSRGGNKIVKQPEQTQVNSDKPKVDKAA